jgi:peptidoglycan/LPS O-acetylase OafA/YrhL
LLLAFSHDSQPNLCGQDRQKGESTSRDSVLVCGDNLPSSKRGILRHPNERNKQLDWLRILFATLVLLSHSQEIPTGDRATELLSRLTQRFLTFGDVGVDGFFLLSGFLIVKSWQFNPEPINYLRKRVLRIVPGYLVAVFLSTVVVGLLAPGVKDFFSHLGWRFAKSILILGSPVTPAVFPGSYFPLVNGSLWTITFEFFCYVLVLICGVMGIFRVRALWLVVTVILLVPTFFPVHTHHEMLVQLFRLTAVFFVGGSFHLFRDYIRFRPLFAAAAVMMLLLFRFFSPSQIEGAVVLFGGYLLFYFVQIPLRALTIPDVSYGIYLYGWPVECLLIWYYHSPPWITFLASSIICFALGWLSWHFVERPALTLKRRQSAPLPAP